MRGAGLRFTRVLRLMTIPDIEQYLNLVHSSNGIRLSQVITKLISVWFAAAGFVHLVSVVVCLVVGAICVCFTSPQPLFMATTSPYFCFVHCTVRLLVAFCSCVLHIEIGMALLAMRVLLIYQYIAIEML